LTITLIFNNFNFREHLHVIVIIIFVIYGMFVSICCFCYKKISHCKILCKLFRLQ